METNLEKAKRLIKANGAIGGYDIPEDGFIFQMMELAATPDKDSTGLIAETLIAKSEAEKLAKALRQIETECDNQNPTHESIWHLAYNAIHDHNSRKK